MATKRSGLFGDWKKVERRLAQLNTRMRKNMGRATRRNARSLRDEMVRTISRGDPSWPALSGLTTGAKGSSKPLADHGDLRNSIKEIPVSAETAFVGVPRFVKNDQGIPMVNIATVQEFGATIQPKKAKQLAIPVSPEAKRLVAEHGGVRNIPGLFRLRGKKVLARKSGGGVEVLFVLTDQVVIPARSFIQSTYNRELPKMKERYINAARQALQGRTYVG